MLLVQNGLLVFYTNRPILDLALGDQEFVDLFLRSVTVRIAPYPYVKGDMAVNYIGLLVYLYIIKLVSPMFIESCC